MPRGSMSVNIMGCCQAKSALKCEQNGKQKTEGGTRKYLKESSIEGSSPQSLRGLPEERPTFTDQQKRLVLDSWQIIQKDISKVGVVMFMRLFETHPDVQDVFQKFKGQSLDSLRQSQQLKSHVLKVMSTVEKCLARIDEPDNMDSLLHNLGATHLLYNAKVDYLDLIGPQFIGAVQPAMGDLWTPEIEAAWADLFRLISHIMKEAMVF